MKPSLIVLLISVFITGYAPSCTGDIKTQSKERKKTISATEPRSLVLVEPSMSSKIAAGNDIIFRLAWADTVGTTDSIEIFMDAILSEVLTANELSTEINTKGVSPGTRRIRAIVHHQSGRKETYISQIMILSDIVPKTYSYRVINTFKHDIGAYTQGFEYFNGYLYEGTGQYNESSVRKTEPETGRVLQARSLPGDIFGEGITILNNKLYQVTYRSQVGFVYDLQTFELLQKIYYQNQEGWGLANDGKSIIMSDGTNNIYFMDPEYFHVLRKIEVMDNTGPVDAINELEWIEGKIWANRYLTDEIVIIDPVSGRVEGRLSLAGILSDEDKHPRIDVLNGIAWDEVNRRLFVTGKYWPKVFEISIIE